MNQFPKLAQKSKRPREGIFFLARLTKTTQKIKIRAQMAIILLQGNLTM